MKVVINASFGGFGISLEALRRLVEKKSSLIRSLTPKKYYGGESLQYINKDRWQENWNKEFVDYEDLGDGMMAHPQAFNIFKEGMLYLLDDNIDEKALRTHNDLIELIETMGQNASGFHAKLKIVEIPDNISWYIDNYDGLERISEAHKSWY
jgi:hypothetical protein